MNRALPRIACSLAAVAALSLTACSGDSAYRKHGHRGRIDPSITTDADTKSGKILPVTLIEFSDQVPQTLTQRLVDTPRIRDTQGQITVIIGDINNKTQIVSSDEFEMMVQRLRSNLLASKWYRDRIRFVESRARMSRIAAGELGVEPGAVPAPKYDPNTTYALNADVFRIGRGESNAYYMQIQIVHFGSNEIVFNDRIDSKQVQQ